MRIYLRLFLITCIGSFSAHNPIDACGAERDAAAAARRWTLRTADTRLTVGVGADQSLCTTHKP